MMAMIFLFQNVKIKNIACVDLKYLLILIDL